MDASYTVLETIQNRRTSLLFPFSTLRLFSTSSHTLCSTSQATAVFSEIGYLGLVIVFSRPVPCLRRELQCHSVTGRGPGFQLCQHLAHRALQIASAL
jgi:hypothetical protein